MTIINQAGAVATGTLGGITAAEIALANHADLGAWFNAKHDQRLLGALPWRARNQALKYFELEDDEIRPTPVTASGMPFLASPTGSSDPYSIPRTTNNVVPSTGNWSIFCVTSGFGAAPIAHAWALVGDNGHALSLRVRSSTGVDVGIGGGASITGLQVYGLAAGLHLVEFAYNRATNFGYLTVDGTFVAGRELVGFTQQRQDLTIISATDHTIGPIGGGRGATLGDIAVATTDTYVNTSFAAAYEAAQLAMPWGADLTIA